MDKDGAFLALEMQIAAASHAFRCMWAIVMREDDSELIVANGEDMDDQIQDAHEE